MSASIPQGAVAPVLGYGRTVVHQPAVVRLLIDHNPFYLLSAFCMLAGCLTLTNSLSFSPIPQWRLLVLIATVNSYEWLLIAIALFLIVGRNLRRDGKVLLGIEALFLVDFAFLNSEIIADDLPLGLFLNAMLLLLAACKLFAILRLLGVPLWPALPVLLVQLLVLYGMAGLFKSVADGRQGQLPALTLYTGWWLAGTFPLLMMLLWRKVAGPCRDIILTFSIFALVSLLVHLCTSNWVYKVRWEPANVAPLLLGLALATGGAKDVASLLARRRVQMILPVLAVLLSAGARDALSFGGTITISPLRLCLLASAGVYVHGLIVHRLPGFGVAAGLSLLLAGLGPSFGQMGATTRSIGTSGMDGVRGLLPTTATQWGVVSVVASFVLLLVGLGVSLLKRPPQDRPLPPEPPLAQDSSEG